MPYGEESAYEAQAKLKGQSPAYKKSSGFKMKGSPLLEGETKENLPKKNIQLATNWKAKGLKKPDEGFAWYKDIDTGKISQMSK